MNNVIFIAPPAAGKGTISDYLVKNYDYEHISTGDLLREEISLGTLIGLQVEQIIKDGKLVRDDIMISLVQKKLNQKKMFILDGFPRTIEQALALDDLLDNLNINNVKVIYLDISVDDVIRRMLGRVVCSKCGRSYNLYNEELKPKFEGICDDCGVALKIRSDDTKDTIKVRYQQFLDNSKMIIDYYENKGILFKVNATDKLEVIYNNVVKVLEEE